jgi:diguanylate cyclase (GGDEF)-like protein
MAQQAALLQAGTAEPAAAGPSQPLARAASWLAGVIALLIALAPPVGYLAQRHAHDSASAALEAAKIAGEVTNLISLRPESWTLQYLRLLGILSPPALQDRLGEARQLTDITGRVLVEMQVPADTVPAAPVLRRAAPVHDQGWPVGEVRITRSMRPALLVSLQVGLLSTLLAVLIFAALRALPLRLLQRAIDRAAWLAAHDPLTGLPNRALFRDRLTAALALARRDGSAVAVLCLDLDHFKEVNDMLGHGAGDRLLREVATRLAGCLRETDTLARLGGDEFAVVQTQTHQPHDAERVAARLIDALAAPFDLDGHTVVIGTSIGIALAENGQSDQARMLQEADLALYQVKAEGRSAFRFHEAAMNTRLLARKALEADLRQALAEGQFEVHFQPQVGLADGEATPRVIGAEALIRWTHPEKGNIRPDQFIPLAEETGLIVPIGEWVLHESCRHAATWPANISVAVNASVVQFRHLGFLATVQRVLADTGLAPSRLELEVTESFLLTDTESTIATLESLRALGVRLAMDDFGTGYSSLGYLRKFRFDKIKIDKSFVSNLGSDAEAGAIVRAVVGITRSLGIRANAEGVETEAQAAMLRQEGCGEAQGYLFGRPMPAAGFLDVLAMPTPLPSARPALPVAGSA